MYNKNKIMFLGILSLIVISGCLESHKEKGTPGAPGVTGTPVATIAPTTVKVTEIPATQVPTPVVTPTTTYKELPAGVISISARMTKPAYWGEGKYELDSLQATIRNQRNVPINVIARIMSGQQILEEESFTLQNEGSTYVLTNDKKHFINSTNVTLQLIVQGYNAKEYGVTEAGSIG